MINSMMCFQFGVQFECESQREKCPYSKFFWSVFSPNAGKYGPEKLQIRHFSHSGYSRVYVASVGHNSYEGSYGTSHKIKLYTLFLWYELVHSSFSVVSTVHGMY